MDEKEDQVTGPQRYIYSRVPEETRKFSLFWLQNRLKLFFKVNLAAIPTFSRCAAFVWITLLSWPYLWQGQRTYVRAVELGDAAFPQLAPIVAMFRRGEFAYWQASQGGGTDLLGNFVSPLANVIVFLALPGWLAHSTIFLLVTGTSTIATYYLLRRSLQCCWISSATAAALYSLWFLFYGSSGIVYVWVAGLVFAAVPLLISFLIDGGALSTRSILKSIGLGVLFGIGGQYSWSFFALGGSLLAALSLSGWLKRSSIICFVIICATCIAIQLPFIIAGLSTVTFSHRSAIPGYYKVEYDQIVHYLAWIQSIFKEYGSDYQHMIFLAVATAIISGLVNFKVPSRTLVGTILLFFALPIIDMIVPVPFAFLHVAGFGFDDTGYGGPVGMRFRWVMQIFLICLAVGLAVEEVWRRGIRNQISLPMSHGSLFKLSFEGILAATWAILLAQNVMHGVRDGGTLTRLAREGMNFFAYYRQPDLVDLAHERPDFDRYRVATVEFLGPDMRKPCCDFRSGSLFPAFQAAYGFQTADAWMSNVILRYVEYYNLMTIGHPGFPASEYYDQYAKKFLFPGQALPQKLYLYEPIGVNGMAENGCIYPVRTWTFSEIYNLNMLSLANVEYIISAVPLQDPHLTLLASKSRRAELTSLLCATGRVKDQAFINFALVGLPIYVYQNTTVIPRVFSPVGVDVFESKNALFNALTTRPVDKLRQRALLMKADVGAANEGMLPKESVSIKNVSFSGDTVRIDTESTSAGIVVVTNAFSPFWHATVNGKFAPVIPAYYAFQAVLVPQGKSSIVLQYLPTYVRLQRWISSSEDYGAH